MDTSSGELLAFIGKIYHAGHTSQSHPILNRLIDITQSNKAFFLLQGLGNQQPLIMELQANVECPGSALLDYRSRPFNCPHYQITKYLTAGRGFG
jgi:hypothetical protein